MSLKKLRKKIDNIDSQIVKLLNERAKEVVKISNLKQKNKLSPFSAAREKQLLEKLIKRNRGPLSAQDLEYIYSDILAVYRALKTKIKVSFLGPKGTFTNLAAVKKFGKKVDYYECLSIDEVFNSVEKGNSDYGVVPIENSIEGAVNYTLDMFFESNLMICSEIMLDVTHSLLARSGKSKIKRIYSHPQVFPQCRRWLDKHYSGVELIPVASTAKAASLAQKDKFSACIGNKVLASMYNLQVIASRIEDSLFNVTRFLVISEKDSEPSGDDKTSILFSVKDKVGALYDILALFKKYKVNLTKIESRPSKKKAWEYYFFVDFAGHRSSNKIKKSLVEVAEKCVFLKILGSYPKG